MTTINDVVYYGGIILVGLGLLVFLAVFLRYGPLWFRAYMSGAEVSIFELIGMSLRRVNPTLIVIAKIMGKQAGLDIDRQQGLSTAQLEAHTLAGGDVVAILKSIIAAKSANIDLPFDRAMAIDLSGRNILEAVQTSIVPIVIDCPDPKLDGINMLSAVAKNGVELLVRARVTVRSNLDQLVGGATEKTIIARIGQGIVSTIGSAESHMDVLENPDRISETVLSCGLDCNTAFQIISIDIVEMEVGENIGARLEIDQAAATTRIAQALAEGRLAAASATWQEMKALVTEKKAELVLAEVDVILALADAFRAGQFKSKIAPLTTDALRAYRLPTDSSDSFTHVGKI